MKKEPLKIATKSVKHTFTDSEHRQYGSELAQAYDTLRGIEAKFDKIKASFKSRTAEVEATVDRISTNITNGFEYRDERCVVVLDLKAGKKHFHLESSLVDGALPKDAVPILTEAITDADRQTELVEAESKFEAKEDIELFKPAGADTGYLTVGRLKGKWFAALRVKIGTRVISERLDSEQPCTKKRPDCVKRACKRFGEWLEENLGHEEAKGFQNELALVVAGHSEREE